MKKIVFSMMVALATTLVFVSCNNKEPLTDAELTDIIITNATYVGTEGTDAVKLQISAGVYTLSYDDLGVFSSGGWAVVGGQMTFQGTVDPTAEVMGTLYPSGAGEIIKDGKELKLTFGTLVFNLKKK